MFKNMFKKVFRNKETLPIQTKGFSTISLWTAGIKYESRLSHVLNCKVHEEVQLVREPNNKNDPNAIHVKRLNGQSLGFVGKFKATIMTPLLDDNKIEGKAHIIDLKCGLTKDIYGVKIAFIMNPIYVGLFAQKVEVIDVIFDKSAKGNSYLLLNCEESILNIVKALFEKNNINIYRSGVSYKAAKNGRYYDWYFFLDEDENEQFIQQLLEDRFPVLKEKSTKKFNEEYLSLQEEELDGLKKSTTELITENLELKKNLKKTIRTLNRLDVQFEKFINILFPGVVFIDPSMDVLQTEVIDFANALHKIKKVVFDEGFRGKPIKTLDNWYDIHFNTGNRDDGRIYFRKDKGIVTILVSFKSEQSKDIKRLSKH